MRNSLAGKRIVGGQIPHTGSASLTFELDVVDPELFCENPYRLRSRVRGERMSDAVAALLEAYFLLALARRWLSTLASSARPIGTMHAITLHAPAFPAFAVGNGDVDW